MKFFSSMKPFQVIVLAVFGFLAILGLVLFANFGGFGGASAKLGTVTIWGTLPASSVNPLLDSLKSGNQEYSGVTYIEKSDQTFDTDLAEAIASGAGPDLVLISQEEFLNEQSKLSVIPFSTISERQYLDTYLPIDELFLSTNGTYGVPFAVDPLVMYYNRTLLSSAGIVSPPTSWEAVTGLAEQMTQQQAGTITRSVVPLGSYNNVTNARGILSLLLLQAGNSITSVGSNGVRSQLNNGGTDTGATTPAEAAVNFYVQFADPVKTVYTWNSALPEARQSFLSGDLAFYLGFASELPYIKAANPNLDFDMAAVPQPQTSAQKVTFAHAYAFAVPRASSNASGAVTVAFTLANPALASAVAQDLSMAPATRASLTPSNTDRYQPVYFPQALIAEGWLSPSPATTDQILSTMIGNITSGRMSVGQALDSANQALDASL